MEYRALGNTGLIVSRLAFGGLTVGPLQANLTPVAGGRVMREAFERGVNLIDTAELYKTYDHIYEAMKGYSRDKVILCTKSYAYDKKTAQESFEKALKDLHTDYLDLFLLHEQESEHTIRGHYEALEYFLSMKEKGYLRAVGLSTHFVAGVNAATKYTAIDVVHPIVNKAGLGIQDGNIEDMLHALKRFKSRGGGIFAMKPFGGGNLLSDIESCYEFVLNEPTLDSIAIGMQSLDEVIANVNKFSSMPTDQALLERLSKTSRKLLIHDWCTGCGACTTKCQHKAIQLIEGKAVVNADRCVLCGYCSAVCPDFCIKVI